MLKKRLFLKDHFLIYRTRLLLLFLCTLFILAQPLGLQAAEDQTTHQTKEHQNKEHQNKEYQTTAISKEKHVVLFLLPHFSFEELELFTDSLPVAIQERLQYAGMSIRTGGRMSLQNNVIGLSTGQQEIGTMGWSGYQQDEIVDEQNQVPAKALYQQRSGRVPEGSIVHPDIYQLQSRWAEKGAKETGPGWLGEALQNHQIYAYALGNSDVGKDKNRFAATFIMNKEGEANGRINQQVLSPDPFFPTGQKTDWSVLSTELARIWRFPTSFTVIEIGDLKRLEAERENISPEHYEEIKREWMKQWAAFLQETIAQVEVTASDKDIALWILSPMVSDAAYQNQQHLLPYITWSQNQTFGLLTSETTKQRGVISHLDLVPSILDFFAIKQPLELVGKKAYPVKNHPFISKEHSGIHLDQWLQQVDYIFTIYGSRRAIITAYLLIVIFSIIASTGYWWFFKRREGIPAVQNVLGTIMLSPSYFLWLTPLIQYVPKSIWIFLLLFGAFLTSWLLYKFCSQAMYLALIGLANTGFILYDILQGSVWMKRSFLGYDPLIGARFYGLGNEYAGILLGSSILAVTGFFVWLTQKSAFEGEQGRRHKLAFYLVSSTGYGIILFAMAAPQLGTNAGATLASLCTYLISQWFLIQVRIGWKGYLLFLGILGGALLCFVFLHLQRGDTHIGNFIRMIALGEFVPVIEVIQRKWEMNLKLIRVSLWGKLFATSLLVLFVLLFRLQREQLRVKKELWYNGFRSIVLGAILILLANDSGIVAAATTMLYVTFPFVFLRLADER